jgi:hypothetical protein
MQYQQSARDALSHLSELPYFDRPGGDNLGQWMEVAGAVAGEMMKNGEGGADTNTSAGMPGSNQGVPRQPSSMNTVSTAVVTQISPQISPVMTQQQSSPGATVGANPMQYMPGGLSADQAMTPYGNQGAPGFPGNDAGISPYQPYGRDASGAPYAIDPYTGQPMASNFDQRGGGAYSPVSVGGSSMTDIPWIPIAIVGGVVALAVLLPKRKTQIKR